MKKPKDPIQLFKVHMAPTAAEEVAKVLNSGYIGQEDDAGSRNNTGGSLDRGNNLTGVEFHHLKWEPVNNPSLLGNEGILLSKDGRIWKRKLPDLDFYPKVRKQYAKQYFNLDL